MDTGIDKQTMDQNSNNSDTMALPVYDELCLNRDEPIGSSPVLDFSLGLALSVNVFLLFAAAVGNMLIVRVFHHVVSINSSSRTLFYSLAASDLCVGFIVQPLNLVNLISNITGNRSLCQSTLPYFKVTGFAMCGVSLLTASEISVDRLLALRLRLSYRQVVSLGRVRLVVVVTWLVSLVSGLTCLWRPEAFSLLQIIGIALNIAVSTVSYACIHHNLRQKEKHRKQRKVPQGVSKVSGFRSLHYKKSLSTALWVYCVLMLCYLPYIMVAALWSVFGAQREVAVICHAFALTLLYFNSAVNPALYCLKIREVKERFKRLLSHVSCN